MLARLLSVAALAVLSSSLLVSGQAPTTGLVHYLPLAGDLHDAVSGASAVKLEGTASCASFPAVAPVSAAWTQTCVANTTATGSIPATLTDSDPLESSDLSMCVEVYYTSLPVGDKGGNSVIFSCDGFATGNVDCLRLYLNAQYGLLVGQVNTAGNGLGSSAVTIPLAQWNSLCITYQLSTTTLSIYLNGQQVATGARPHVQNSYAAPLLAGDGPEDTTAPTTASFLNWRVYNVALTQAQVLAIAAADQPTANIRGDPQFVGLRGQSFQVHGIDGAVYNLISEPNTQVNGRFVFLSEGQCPMIDGLPADNCWSHPGSYIGELSFQQVVAGRTHAALVTSGDAKRGFAAVQMDGKALQVGDKAVFGSFSLEFRSAYSVAVSTEHFEFVLDNSDLFINQAMRSKVPLSKLSAHGLLGQTHSSKTYKGAIPQIEGRVDDYSLADGDLFGDDFVFNQFQA